MQVRQAAHKRLKQAMLQEQELGEECSQKTLIHNGLIVLVSLIPGQEGGATHSDIAP